MYLGCNENGCQVFDSLIEGEGFHGAVTSPPLDGGTADADGGGRDAAGGLDTGNRATVSSGCACSASRRSDGLWLISLLAFLAIRRHVR